MNPKTTTDAEPRELWITFSIYDNAIETLHARGPMTLAELWHEVRHLPDGTGFQLHRDSDLEAFAAYLHHLITCNPLCGPIRIDCSELPDLEIFQTLEQEQETAALAVFHRVWKAWTGVEAEA